LFSLYLSPLFLSSSLLVLPFLPCQSKSSSPGVTVAEYSPYNSLACRLRDPKDGDDWKGYSTPSTRVSDGR
ncbi:unnamed protein product, partial [Linum tenue]